MVLNYLKKLFKIFFLSLNNLVELGEIFQVKINKKFQVEIKKKF